MLRRKRDQDDGASLRPKITISGICTLLGICRSTFYSRIEDDTLSLQGVPFERRKSGYRFDMEGVFRRVFPSADGNMIAQLMYDFMQKTDGRGTK